jgi:phenylpropionate dioxygenase-like ring-hydroxylating dioxygenase large terminal subunit
VSAPQSRFVAVEGEFERFALDKKDCALKQVALDVCAGMILVNFSKQPPALRSWLGDPADQMETLPVARATTFSEYHYDIAANWKLTYDNFQENYHLRFIHPRSGGSGIAPENPFGYPVSFGFHDPHRTQTVWTQARQAFYDAMNPLIPVVLERLDTKPLDAHDAAESRLMLLALAYAHVATAIEVQGPDEAAHAKARQRLPISYAPADQ